MPVHVVGVDADSPMQGYLHVGDTIVRLGDIEVVSPQVLRDLLHDWPSSGSLRLTVIRDHHTLHVTAPLPDDRHLGMDLAHVPDRRAPDADRRASGSSGGRRGSAAAAPAATISVDDALAEVTGAASAVRTLGGVLALVLAAVGVALLVAGVLGTCPDGSTQCPASFKGLNIGFVAFGAAIALAGGWLFVAARAIGARLRLAAALAQSRAAAAAPRADSPAADSPAADS